MKLYLSQSASHKGKVRYHHLVSSTVLTAAKQSRNADGDREVRPLTFRAVLEVLSFCPRMFKVCSLLPQKAEERVSACCLYRGCSFRCIDPSDVQSLRLISAVPGVHWRRCCYELDCLFSQITAPWGSPILSHILKRPATTPKEC